MNTLSRLHIFLDSFDERVATLLAIVGVCTILFLVFMIFYACVYFVATELQKRNL